MKLERPEHSLQATALVNEAYMRLVDYKRMQWRNLAHFFAVSAQVIRRIHLVLEEPAIVGGGQDADLVALDDATNSRARIDQRKLQVVEMLLTAGTT